MGRDYNKKGNNNRNNDYNDNEQKKRSGAKRGQTKDGNPWISAWNYSRSRGMLTALAFPYNNTHETESNSGKKWQNWMVKLKWKKTGQEKVVPCLYCVTDGRVHVNSEWMIINPSKNYFGTKSRKN